MLQKTVPDLGNGHGLIHIGIEGVALLAGENVEYFNTTVSLSSGDVLVVGIETHAESLPIRVSQGILVLHFNL
jgi:hypothetical protein